MLGHDASFDKLQLQVVDLYACPLNMHYLDSKVCVCMRGCMCVCMCVCVCVCVVSCVFVCAV